MRGVVGDRELPCACDPTGETATMSAQSASASGQIPATKSGWLAAPSAVSIAPSPKASCGWRGGRPGRGGGGGEGGNEGERGPARRDRPSMSTLLG